MNREKRTKQELLKRYVIFICSLFFCALGVAITKKGELGVSPISSVGNILSIRFDFLTLGNWLILWNCTLVVGEILVLRKDFQIYQLLQVPLSFVFGYFTDCAMRLVSGIEMKNYPMRVLMVLIGTVVIAFGVFLAVLADVIMNAGEAFVKALSDKTKQPFPKVKTIFDISCVSATILMSLMFFSFKIVGTREGTLIAACCTGPIVAVYNRILKKPVKKLLKL